MTTGLYPTLLANLDPRRTKNLNWALEKIEAAQQTGQIANPDFQSVKSFVNSALEDAWTKVIREKYTYAGKWESLPREVYEVEMQISYPQAHSVNSLIKKLDAAAKKGLKHQMLDDMRAYVNEIAPLAAAVVDLKDKVVKRQPKPVEDRKAKYEAPAASQGAIGFVKNVLTEVTEKAYQEMLEKTIKTLNTRVDALIELLPILKLQRDAGIINHRKTSPEEKRAKELQQRLASSALRWSEVYDSKTGARKPDANEVITACATKLCDHARESFIYKNLDKIASILDAKADFEKIESIGYTTNMASLEGEFRVTFKDGSRFDMKNSVVWVVNSYGTQFNRFPLTFHNVVMAGGKRMKGPSEKKMNTEFVGKEA